VPINLTHLILKKCRLRASTVAAIWVFIMVLALPQVSIAETSLVVLEKESTYQKKFLSLLEKSKPDNHKRIIKSILLRDISKNIIEESNADVVISLGKNISKKLIDFNLAIPTIHTLLTQSDAKTLTSCIPACRKQRPYDRFLVLDQPTSRQLKLVQLIKPTAKNIGIFYTENSSLSLSLVKQAAEPISITVEEYATEPSSLGFQLNDVARDSDIILALADTSIYNTSTLPQILLTSYRHHTPINEERYSSVITGVLNARVATTR
jgi:putative ABC transport system substrate-binding protein